MGELVSLKVDVILSNNNLITRVAKEATTSIPIVMVANVTPVQFGLVASLSRPNSNATGFADVFSDLSSKYVELAREVTKSPGTIDYLWHTGWPDGQPRRLATERAAQSLGVKLRSCSIGDADELNDVLTAIKKDGAVTLIIQQSPYTYRKRDQIIESGMKHGLATIVAWPPSAREGALIAYGPDYIDMYRRVGSYVDRIILKAVSPADLPVQEPTKFELAINLKTAKALGLTIPPSLLARADEVIQ